MRDLARPRVRYSDAEKYTAPGETLTSSGTITVVNGSPIVTGVGTNWNESILGHVLRVDGDSTAYTVTMVIGPEKLAVSREYGGGTASGVAYTITEDGFVFRHLAADAPGQACSSLVGGCRAGAAPGPPGTAAWSPAPGARSS